MCIIDFTTGRAKTIAGDDAVTLLKPHQPTDIGGEEESEEEATAPVA